MSGGIMNMEDLQRMLSGGGPQVLEPRKSPPDVLIITLREYLEHYAAGCRFAVGDLVTPKKGAILKDAGEPYIVAEVFAEPIRMLGRSDKMYNTGFGARVDMRVFHESNGSIAAHCVESWMFEEYVGQPAQGTAN